MTNNVQILIAAHKKFPMPKAKGYIPILVGARKIINQIYPIKEMMKEKIYLKKS